MDFLENYIELFSRLNMMHNINVIAIYLMFNILQ